MEELDAKNKPKTPPLLDESRIALELSLITLVIGEVCAEAKIDLNACIHRAQSKLEMLAAQRAEKKPVHPEGARIFSATE